MKKGFTLIELLAVITLITVLTLLIMPNLLNNVNNEKSSISESAKKIIYDATDIYVKENSEIYPSTEGLNYCIKLETLVNSGKLVSPIKDMKKDKEIPLNYYVKATANEYNQFDYELVDNNNCKQSLTYSITSEDKYTKSKKIFLYYPSQNFVKKYKILSGTTKENIELNKDIATELKEVEITFTSNGEIIFWVEDLNGNKVTSETFKIINIDNTNPILTLSKETYVDVPIDSKWTLTNASINEQVLSLNTGSTSAKATSDYIQVDGEFWYMSLDAYTETSAEKHNPKGGVYWSSYYYDGEYNATTSLDGFLNNGFSVSLQLNQWVNNIFWKKDLEIWKSLNRYGPNVKYIKLIFKVGDGWSAAPVKIRNLKVYGQMTSNFYFINIKATDDTEVTKIKYAKGEKDLTYFDNFGTVVKNNQIKVTENGTYTVCAYDAAGNKTIQKIVIDKIKE